MAWQDLGAWNVRYEERLSYCVVCGVVVSVLYACRDCGVVMCGSCACRHVCGESEGGE